MARIRHKKPGPLIWLLATLLVGGLFAMGEDLASPATEANPAARASLVGTASVIDGDTMDIHGQRIRLHGIDAPESAQTCQRNGRNWRCGREAALALSDRIGRRPVSCVQKDIDHYGRIVAACTVGGESLNAWMVREGWAAAYRQYSRDYVAEEQAARNSGRGIWAGPFSMPWEWRRTAR